MKSLIQLLFLIPLFLMTQISHGQKVAHDVELGLISSLNTDYKYSDFKNRRNTFYLGYNVNLYTKSPLLSFTSGVHYIRQGYQHKTCYFFEPGVRNLLVGKVDYLAVPLQVNFHLLQSRDLVFSLGTWIGYNIKAKQDYPKAIGGCQLLYIEDLSSVTKDFSTNAQIALKYRILERSKYNIYIGTKYFHGLTNIANFSNVQRRNHSHVLSLSYEFK